MHGFWRDPDVWKDITTIVGNLVVGTSLLFVRRWMRNSDRDKEEHKKAVAAQIAAVVPASDIHARGTAAGASNGVDKDSSDSSGHRDKRHNRLRDS